MLRCRTGFPGCRRLPRMAPSQSNTLLTLTLTGLLEEVINSCVVPCIKEAPAHSTLTLYIFMPQASLVPREFPAFSLIQFPGISANRISACWDLMNAKVAPSHPNLRMCPVGIDPGERRTPHRTSQRRDGNWNILEA